MSETLQYKCPSCGGAVEFDSSTQQMKCPYCDTSFEIEVIKEYNETLNKETQDNVGWEEYTEESGSGDWTELEAGQMVTYLCQSCGGEIITTKETGATKCPYCDNVVVISSNFSNTLRPDYIIPFKLSKEEAMAAYYKHIQGKTLLPKLFKQENKIKEIKGVYIPFWLYDCDADGSAIYKTIKVRRWSDSKYNYTETSHYQVSRAGNIKFSKIPADGSEQMPNSLMESIEPFDYRQLVDFETAYMAGYLADKYTVKAEDNIPRINTRMKETLDEKFRQSMVDYTTVTCQSCNVKSSNTKISYVLLPVWMLSTTYKGDKYMFAMNGQTGKFVGNLPLDKSAYRRWFAGISTVAFIAAYVALSLFL